MAQALGVVPVHPIAEADGLVEVAEDTTRIAPGDPVEFVPFSEFGVPG